jgi:medium-chain acyl-[acyl-carrier-protein] hydrolase
LKADHALLYNYTFVPKPSKLKCDITALYGLDENNITTPDIEHWRTHTEKQCRIIPFKGAHFFIEDNARNVVSIINQTLMKYVS